MRPGAEETASIPLASQAVLFVAVTLSYDGGASSGATGGADGCCCTPGDGLCGTEPPCAPVCHEMSYRLGKKREKGLKRVSGERAPPNMRAVGPWPCPTRYLGVGRWGVAALLWVGNGHQKFIGQQREGEGGES
jgi:hypothetical protein